MSDDATGEAAPTAKNRARHTRGVWFTIAALLTVVAVFGAVWMTRGREARAEGCDCEHRVQLMRQNGFADRYPPAPELSPQERADRENQLVVQLDAYLLGKSEIVDQFITTRPKTEGTGAVAHFWRTSSDLPCWTGYKDHGAPSAELSYIQVVQSTCGHKGLYAFAVYSGGEGEERYNTWGFFDLRLKDGAS